jgi:DNA-directed RNA polymerase subunit omega
LRYIIESLAYRALGETKREELLNSEICKKALEKVGNPNVLVNLVSRRVRQLNSGGAGSRPLITDTAGLGAADIAMLEMIEGKMDWQILEEKEEDSLDDGAAKRRKKS